MNYSNKNFIVLVLGLGLLFLGLSKTTLVNRNPINNTTVDSISPPEPPEYLRPYAEKVVGSLIVNSERKKG